MRRHKALVGGVAAVLVVSVIGTVVSVIFALGQARARAEAQAVANFLTHDVLGSVRDANAYEQTLSYVLDSASKNLVGKFDDQPLVEASIRHTLGWTYYCLGEQTKGEQHLERALRLYEEQLGENHRLTLGRMHDLG